jgi:polyferredoxin
MIICFVLLRKMKMTERARVILYGLGFFLFGVVLGADPSPMGTVKDAIVLYASKGVIFKPRMIAFAVFTLTVVLANKFICSWGCQLGALQDFIFRLNRNSKGTGRGSMPQFKIPFVVSNGIRVLFLIALIWVAFTWSYDITHEIDPFKVFKPAKVSIAGWIFILGTLILSLFVYRPWCHLFCPFGLTGWLFEKLSLFRIKVNYDACIACGSCAKSCPSPVMGAILKRDAKVIPDCFSCGSCIETCPTKAIAFTYGQREKPPAGKFAG